MSRMDKLKAKTENVRATADIPDSEVAAIPHVPKSGQGAYARRQSLEERIAELEKFGGEVIPVASIAPNPWQPRRVFNEDEIRKLADSITEVGLIQPIVVRRKCVATSDNSKANLETGKNVASSDTLYELVAGERRWRANRLLGRKEIKAIVIDATNEEMALMSLAENLDREDLTDYETSKAILRAENEFTSKAKMAEAIGINRTDFHKYFAYRSLPSFITSDLEVSPGLLGRNAAVQLVTVLKEHGAKGNDVLATLWPQVKSGHLDQTKLAPAIKTFILRGPIRTDRDIKKLFVGKEQAGSITRDASSLTIKIRTAALDPEQEGQLRAFVEGLFKE